MWFCYLLPSFYQINSTVSSLYSDTALSKLYSPELGLSNYSHLPFLHLSHSPNSSSHLLAVPRGRGDPAWFSNFKKPERDLIQTLLFQKHSSELGLTRTRAGFNGIVFTQVLHHPDSCWFGYDNFWPSWERTESFYSNLNDLSQKTASSNMQPNSCLQGRIFKPSLCCFSFQIDIVFLEVMSRDMVFIKCSNGNGASQITCHCYCPVLRALFNGRINTGKRGRHAELTHYLVSSLCDPPETLPEIKLPFRPKLAHLFLS